MGFDFNILNKLLNFVGKRLSYLALKISWINMKNACHAAIRAKNMPVKFEGLQSVDFRKITHFRNLQFEKMSDEYLSVERKKIPF
jgi:hypothetical protein